MTAARSSAAGAVPASLADYQTNMKGVDLMDQMIGYYMMHHRSTKWWRRIFHYLMMASAHNAYVVAQDSNPDMVQSEWPNMKGVDLMDQMIGYYMMHHRSTKWWRRIFHYLMMASAHNAYVVAQDSNPDMVQSEWPNFQDFLEEIALSLIGESRTKCDPVANPRPAPHGAG